MSPRLAKVPWRLRYQTGAHLASELRRLSVVATHRHCRIEFRGPVRLGPGFALRIPDNGTLIIGAGVDLRRGFVCEISGDGRVVIGDGTIFTSHALIQCSTSIEIGKRCAFGQAVLLSDGNHRYGDPTKNLLDQGYNFRPLSIGDNAIITAKATVMADVGEGALVGAGSVVTKPIPPHCLALGAPARVVRSFLDDLTPAISAEG